MNEMTLNDFEAELLPERNTLSWLDFSLTNMASPIIFATNTAQPVQAVTLLSSGTAVAQQTFNFSYGMGGMTGM